jgi:carboxymethylenebutenolidase
MVNIELPDGTAEAILAAPSSGRGPGVLMFMDAYGLRPQIQELAERVASWGYVVLAPNVFYRDGTVAELAFGDQPATPQDQQARWARIGPRMANLTTERALADIDGYVAALRGRPEVTGGPLGTVGFCMGGRLAVRAACQQPDEFAACAGFHTGGLVTDDADSPHLALGSAKAEFVFGHADHDRSMTPENVATLGDALLAAGLTAINVIVPDAAHGYTMSDTPAWNEAASEWAFEQLRELYDHTLR